MFQEISQKAEQIKNQRGRILSLFSTVAITSLILGACTSSNAQCANGRSLAGSNDSLHVQILLDDSSSMDELTAEVIDSFNELISTLPKTAIISLYGFGDQDGLDVIIENEPVSSVEPLDNLKYVPDGLTPLYDSISFALTRNELQSPTEQSGQDHVFIISDGGENDSVLYDLNQTRKYIRSAISRGTQIHFIALGEDAYAEAINLGIEVSQATNFTPDEDGVNDAFNNIGSSFNQQSSGAKCNRFLP